MEKFDRLDAFNEGWADAFYAQPANAFHPFQAAYDQGLARGAFEAGIKRDAYMANDRKLVAA